VSKVECFADATTLQREAANTIARLLHEAVAQHGNASLVLSGGSTPKAVYELLGAEPLRSHVAWGKVHVFWGDERCVPPTHPDSNFRMANKALLEKIDIPASNIHRIQAEQHPGAAAASYEEEMRTFFRLNASAASQFDVTLLGMGEDGHTASLFPNTTILSETKRLVADVFVPKFNAHRISMTFPALNTSRTILFLITGESKAEILRAVLEGEPNRFPAQRIQPTNGRLVWYVDNAAAANLKRKLPTKT
jgi:6-phosphogluconolactonase